MLFPKKSLKKVMSISGRHYRLLDDLKNNFPTFKRQIVSLQQNIDDNMHTILGRIEADRKMAKDTKALLSGIVKNSITKWLPDPNVRDLDDE